MLRILDFLLNLLLLLPESLLAFRPEELTDEELNQLLDQLEAGEDLELKKETNPDAPGTVAYKFRKCTPRYQIQFDNNLVHHYNLDWFFSTSRNGSSSETDSKRCSIGLNLRAICQSRRGR